ENVRKARGWGDRAVEEHFLQTLEASNDASGLFRMWTHPDDWQDQADEYNTVNLSGIFKRRGRLGDMLHGVYAGDGSNCDNGESFDAAPLDFSDVAAWQHDADYGRDCSFFDRGKDTVCGCRAAWADSRLCECRNTGRPHVDPITGGYLDMMD